MTTRLIRLFWVFIIFLVLTLFHSHPIGRMHINKIINMDKNNRKWISLRLKEIEGERERNFVGQIKYIKINGNLIFLYGFECVMRKGLRTDTCVVLHLGCLFIYKHAGRRRSHTRLSFIETTRLTASQCFFLSLSPVSRYSLWSLVVGALMRASSCL